MATNDSLSASLARRTVTVAPQPGTVEDMLDRYREEFARALPSHVGVERFLRLGLTVFNRTPGLRECTATSFVGSLMTCAQLGLEPGPTDEVYLVPYENRKAGIVQATFVLGYKGMAALFWRHPMAKYLDAQVVYEADEFDYQKGSDPWLYHKASLEADRGKVIAYWGAGGLTNGGSRFEVLSPTEIERHRKMSKQPNGFGWRDHYEAMARKTCIRSLFSLLPKTVDMGRALAADERVREGIDPAELDAPRPELEEDPLASIRAQVRSLAEGSGLGQDDVSGIVDEMFGPDVDFGTLGADQLAQLAAELPNRRAQK